jgi:TonB family protein
MKQRGGWPHVFAAALTVLSIATPLAAQNRLYVLEPSTGQYHRVLKVSGDQPYIMDHGNLVAAGGRRFALIKAEEFLPFFIAIDRKEVGSTGWELTHFAPSVVVNKLFHFSAEFNSPYPLEDVFLALELEFAGEGRNIFVYEVGKLEPWTPRPYSVDVPMNRDVAPFQCRIHLFAGGGEVFTSEQPLGYREEMLDRMISKRVASVQQAGPAPFFSPAPGYPAALRKAGIKGRAVVAVRITPKGAVIDPVVESASDPAFGEAALSAVRGWRFIPRVKDGRAVESRVEIPIAFDPSQATGR